MATRVSFKSPAPAAGNKKHMGVALKSRKLHIVRGNVPFARVPQVIDLFQGFQCMRSLGHIITDPHKVNNNQQ